MERSPIPPPHPIAEVDSFVVAAHPLSTNGPLAKTWAKILQAAEPDKKVFFVPTEGWDVAANHDLVVNGIKKSYDCGHKNPLFISGGGDGTLHYNGMALMHYDTPEYIARTLMTPWKLGRACDGYRSLHDPKTQDSPLALLEHPDGHVVESNPLVIRTLTEKDKVYEDVALLYATFGPSADAAYKLATPKHRAWRGHSPKWLHTAVDITASAPIMLSLPPRADTRLTKAAPPHYVVEAEFINSSSMTGKANFGGSTDLGDRALHYAEIRRRNPLAVIWFAGRLAIGHPPGYRSETPVALVFKDGTVHGQLDGEPLSDEEGELANVRAIWAQPGPRAIRYYATRKYPKRTDITISTLDT